MSDQPWIPVPELEPMLETLSTLVIGQTDSRTGEVITSPGVGCNCAQAFENDVFALRDYCWCEGSVHPEVDLDEDDEDAWNFAIDTAGGTGTGCPVNFEHKPSGLQAVWYKHLGRDTIFNRAVLPGEAAHVLASCIGSLLGAPTRTITDPALLELYTADSAERWAKALALLAK